MSIGRTSPLKVITLIFAILAAISLCLGALYTTVVTVLDVVVNYLVYGDFNFLGDGFLSILENYGFPLLVALAMFAAAVLVAVNREGALMFLPMGFIAPAAFSSMIMTAMIISFSISSGHSPLDFVNESGIGAYASSSLTTIMLCIMIAVPTYFSAQKKENFRYVPMAVLFILLTLGSVSSLFVGASNCYFNITAALEYDNLFSLEMVQTAFVPLLRSGNLVFAAIGAFFATFAAIPYDN